METAGMAKNVLLLDNDTGEQTKLVALLRSDFGVLTAYTAGEAVELLDGKRVTSS
jgi:hypothetical protein